MSRPGKFVVVASAIWLVVSEVIAAHRTTNGMLLSLLITLLFLPLRRELVMDSREHLDSLQNQRIAKELKTQFGDA